MTTMDTEEEIKTAARGWLLRLSLESPSATERAQFAAWCEGDPRHAAAYRRFESIWHDAAKLEGLRGLAPLPTDRGPWWPRVRASFVLHPQRWTASVSLPVAMTALVLWLLLTPARYTTGIAEVRDVHLSDGSEVTLGARSSLEVTFRRHERHVALTSGVAFFSVAKNPARPFIVRVGDKQVRAVGTQFEIRRDPAGMRVSVLEGTVEVTRASEPETQSRRDVPNPKRVENPGAPPANPTIRNGALVAPYPLTNADSSGARILTAGQEVTTSPLGVFADTRLMPNGEAAAWRHGRLVYVDAPLKDIIADANRYSREPIEIADDDVANVRISVTYPSDRIQEMVSALSRSLSLEIQRREGGGIVLKAKRAKGRGSS